jgi:hypothetical protein
MMDFLQASTAFAAGRSSQLDLTQLNSAVFFFVKVIFLIGFFLYVLFAFLAVRQIEEMRKTIVTPLSPFIQIAGYLHFFFAIGMLIFAFLFLG